MKKIISIVLAVIMVASLGCVSFGAVDYNYTDSYTVSLGTPTCDEAILACGGSLDEVQTVYFQLPAEDPEHPENNWTNKFNILDGNPFAPNACQVCAYWWTGIGKTWPNGNGVQWVGYRTKLVDPVNRIYAALLPGDGNTSLVVWNNGVNGGMDPNAEIFNYARQLLDVNVEGAEPGDYPSLPEGTPDPDTEDGCISIIDYNVSQQNSLTGFYNFGSNLYVYYGNGCYGCFATDSENFVSVAFNDVNPDHHHCDVDLSGAVDAVDVTRLQRCLADIQPLSEEGMTLSDPDDDGVTSIMDATRIQRYLASVCNIDGSKPYKAEANAYLNAGFAPESYI